ncbi:MAG TPA: hypothetical protein VN812_10445 [Candidatus Acidoferrales bacterium]|nr:hypothetical protein [Candidatus Acidoferrales bacterium]
MSELSPTDRRVVFARAADILTALKDRGICNPSIRLYADGSGRLFLGLCTEVGSEELKFACESIGSMRVGRRDGELAIDFFQSLISAESQPC